MISRTLYIICFLFFFSVCSGQIAGIVLDKLSQKPLADVEVLDLKTGTTFYTQLDGRFLLDLKNDSSTHLIFYKEGFQVLDNPIQSIQDTYVIELEKLQFELSEVELISEQQEIFATKKLKDIVGTSIYAGKKTEAIVLDLVKANTASNVSRQIYAQISGLNIYEGSDGGLQLNIGGRGLDPNRTSNFNTRQNGYDISADVLGYPENYYTPPSDALEEIRIVRGASSLQYGTQFGGLIDFQTRKIARYRKLDIRTKQTIASFGFFNSFNSIGYNQKRFSIDAYYNFKKGDGYRNNSQFDAHNAFLSSRFYLSDKSTLSLEFTHYNYLAKQAGGLTDLQFEINPRLSTRERNWFMVDWQLYNLKFLHQFDESQKVEFNVFGLNASRNSVGFRGNPISLNENPILAIDEISQEGEYLTPRDLILGKFRNIGTEIRYLKNYQTKNSGGTFLMGLKYYNSQNSSVQGPGSNGVDADFSLQTSIYPDYPNQSSFEFPNLNLAVFAENVTYLNDKLSITPGLRFEYIKTESEGSFQDLVFDLAGNPIANNRFDEMTSLSRQFLIAGVGLDYLISKQLKYSINISQNYRSVTFSDIRVVSPSFIVDEDIADERGYTFSTSLTGRVKQKFSYDATLYSVLYNDRIGIILDDRANRVRTNVGDAVIAGVESLFNFIPVQVIKNNEKIFQVKTFLNASYTFSQYLRSLSNNVVGNQVEFIPSLNIKTGISLDYKKFNAGLQFSYLADQFTDAQNSEALLTNDFRSGLVGEIPSYNIFDLSLGYTWNGFSIDAGVNNLLDRNYFTRRATGYPGPGIIPSEGRSFYFTLVYNFVPTVTNSTLFNKTNGCCVSN